VQTGGANSADIVGDPDLPSTTSYITGYFAPGVPQPIATSIIHLLFVGDLMFDRAVAEHAQKFGIDSLFTNIDRLFLGTHAVIGNLEGTITNEQSLSIENNSILRFTFNPIFAGLLKKNAFTTVSLANNHALDFGKSGYVQTEENLQAAGIVPFGSPFNNENISTKITADGKTICFIGYHDLFTSDPTSAFQEIKNIRPACSYITLFAHWGVEYVSTATDRQRMLAHQFIDAGADLVIGSHPHVVETVEVYKNKAIFYSLGNFMFDQSFSFGTEHGLAVNVEWNGAQTQFTLVPTTLRHAEVSVADITDQAKILSALVDKNTPQDITSAIMKTKSFTLWNTSQSNQ
jgi:poly-gamma-glutamate synthesis protein (capsule biosynthesis protein)